MNIQTSKKAITILVVDDEDAITGLMSAILTKEGYTVHIAGNGVDGVASASQCKPDIIFMDITMPDMDGYQATSQIKQNPALKDIPIIFLSGKSASEDGGRSFATGGLTYMRKPFTSQQLRDMVTLTLMSIGK
ncbi:MAG TPA: response regulator [Candidatus Acidoferrum sp.]|nr:response regulator [Candidatus Acidoferrum sp.]